MPEYKLHYFALRGYAEPIRLVFALAKVPFEDYRIPYTLGGTNEVPPEIKKNSPYGQVPFLQVGDEYISQSATIARFLSRKFNLMGANDLEAARVDEIVDACRDYNDTFRPLWTAKTDEERAAAKKNVVDVSTPKYFSKFNQILEKNGTGFLVGSAPSLADLVLFNMVTNVEAIVQVDVTKEYAAVAAHFKKIGDIPQIKEWVEKRPKTQF